MSMAVDEGSGSVRGASWVPPPEELAAPPGAHRVEPMLPPGAGSSSLAMPAASRDKSAMRGHDDSSLSHTELGVRLCV